jgi:hypothetical protein
LRHAAVVVLLLLFLRLMVDIVLDEQLRLLLGRRA